MTELRRLGATDFHVLPLVLGGNVFGWTIDQRSEERRVGKECW